jgi:threonine ammonia-lyase medium form
MRPTLITTQDIADAQTVIAGRLHRTPIQPSTYLSGQTGARVYLKLELFQKTGSFKPRGVLNRLHHMSPEEKSKGVITLSAGNHAQAVAWAAQQEGISATVIMPANAVQSKVDATRGYGGEVIQTDGNLLEVCQNIQKERGLILVHPFDHPDIIAGQGTVGQEILEDVPDVDLVIAGVGGGGLISGVSAAIKQTNPEARVIGVEPEGAPTMTRSMEKKAPVYLDHVDTVADGLAAPFVGAHNLAHVQTFVDDLVQISDTEIIQAMWLIIERCKVIAEPAAASTVAALLSGKVTLPEGGQVVCILSGGNVDRERLKKMA